MDKDELRPNEAEKIFLNLAFNRFYDLYDLIMVDSFWEKEASYRFLKIKDVFALYSELLNYEPIVWVINHLKKVRPPMEAEISSELLKFIRNVVSHFPFFESWNDIWINKQLVNWNKDGQSIDRFLKKYEGHKQVKYRFWEAEKKRMTYLSINFPNKYSGGQKIILKDILSEKEGVKFSIILMRKILDTQIERNPI